MNTFFEQLKKQAHEIRLSTHEKQAMRARIFKGDSLAREGVALRSPYVFFSFSLRSVVSSCLVVLIGSGTAYAAQGALPGEPLYALKINVNERVEEALAVTPTQKSEVQTRLAERRVEEAEALAAKGELTATTTAELRQNFDEHAQGYQELAVNLRAQDPGAAAQIQARFDSSLKVHGEILARIGARGGNAENKQGSNALSGHVRAQGSAATTASSTRSLREKEVQQSLEQKAREELNRTSTTFAALQGTLDATTRVQVEAQLNAIDTRIVRGDFKSALEAAVKLGVLLTAGEKYDHGLVAPLIEQGSDSGHPGSGDSGDNGGGVGLPP